ncbi:SGNH/GDSL hydrolase family protein [Micromonospora sp. DR5-3]|uniref:SGNH/GDSL hydrolase family protein n=1 Tax=unclassified Micromonospora TaxID=2617518 RepID=UPI001651F26B|nr:MULTISPECIES: SGNH/GDSL hydrolase family protein [unclassified Micromonospora]MCW3817848.1 SGNH/GDSL hydrolase family protein [Micromonospora sp. DR5-3]
MAVVAALVMVAGLAVPAMGSRADDGKPELDHGMRAWSQTWQAAPQKPQQAGFADQTLRMIVHTSIGGERVRIRLSNTFGAAPVLLDGAFVGLLGSGASISGRNVRLTFGGSPGVTLPEGGDVVSDPADLTVPALADLAVSLYLPRDTGPPTGHADFGNAHQTSYIASGDHAAAAAGTAFTGQTRAWFFLSGVSVPSRRAAAVVTLGDSITDGTGSSTDTNSRYPDALARRLAARPQPLRLGVGNAGIGGNELLRTSACCGASPSVLARLDRDVLAQDGVRSVILLAGINDIGGDHHADAASLIAGVQQVATQLRAHGIRVLGGTITPSYGRPGPYGTQQTEDVRQQVNAWVRTADAFDAVVDFDQALRDPEDPRRLRAGYDSGDHLHPSDAGYQAMAEAVPLDQL